MSEMERYLRTIADIALISAHLLSINALENAELGADLDAIEALTERARNALTFPGMVTEKAGS